MRRLEVPRTLLVLKPSSFGDIIHTLPAVARLKAAWPDCRISWLANPEWSPLLEGNPTVAEIIPFPRGDFRGWGGGWRWLKWLHAGSVRRRFDLALDFQGLLRTAVVARASGSRQVIGLDDAREGATWLYHQVVSSPKQPVHALKRYLTLAASVISGAGNEADGHFGEMTFPLPSGQTVDLSPDFKEGFVLLHPYARGRGKSLNKRITRDFIRHFSNSKIVLIGRGNADIATQDGGCLNLVNQTNISQLIWLLRRASFVVSVDSGPAHLAAALGRPLVAIHAWSDPRQVGPFRDDAWVWKNGSLVQVRDLGAMSSSFFEPRPLDLRAADVAAIAALATTLP